MKTKWLWLGLILLAAAGWKVALLALDVVPFNADEAIVGLMARHILQGEIPIFFYGQSYMGSLDALLVAGGFLLFGKSVWVIRLVQILLYLGLLVSTVWLGKEAFGRSRQGILAAALLAIPTVNVGLYTTVSLGGYGEAMLIGNLLLILVLRQAKRPGWGGWLLIGLLSGLGLWANGLTLVFSLPGILYLVIKHSIWQKPRLLIRSLGALILGGCLGALPWWIYAWQNGMTHLISELLGSAVAVEQTHWVARSAGHLVNFLLLGLPVILGLRPPWGITWLAIPLIPFALVAWGWVLISFFHGLRVSQPNHGIFALLGGVGLTLFCGFIFTSFGVDPSGRYFLPLAVPLVLLAADFALRATIHPSLRMSCLVCIAAFQLWGNLQSAFTYPPGFTTQFDATTIVEHRNDQALIQFLKAHGLTRGYSQYWISYPLAFLSDERLIYTPRLPYHQDLRYTSRDNRYAAYNPIVDGSNEVTYITAHNPNLDERIVTGFQKKGLSWSEEWVGDYHIFYNLSQPARPEELNIYLLSP